MTLAPWKPVEFQQSNQLLDFTPLMQGLSMANNNLNQERWDRRANERLSMERQRFKDQQMQDVRERAGNIALLTLQEQDPVRKSEKWAAFLQTHPDAKSLEPKYHDPSTGPLAVLADAKMAQHYLDWQMKQAGERRANAQLGIAQNQDARASAESAARLSQDQNLPYEKRVERAGRYFTPEESVRGNARYEQYLNTGAVPPPADPYKVMKENETLVSMPRQPGQKPVAIYPENPVGKDESKFKEEAAKAQVGRYDETVKQGTSQSSNMGTITSLRNLSDNIGAPGVGNTIARTLGPSLRNVGIEVGKLSDMEAFNAIVSRLVPAQRPPGSGTMSDRDVDLFKKALPELSATAQGRKFVLDQMEAIARYDIKRAEITSKALNGEMSRQQAEVTLRQMPDPMELFRQRTKQGQGGAGANNSGWSARRID